MTSIKRKNKATIVIETDREKILDAMVSQTAKELGQSVEQRYQKIVTGMNLVNMDVRAYERDYESRKELA